jgi:hypothetical protein
MRCEPKKKLDRRHVLGALAAVGALSAEPLMAAADTAANEDHAAWVATALRRIQTIKPSMTRSELLKVFTVEGGLSTALQRTFVSQDCPYFKVDVTFRRADGLAPKDIEETDETERRDDVIVTISRPYLEFSIAD